MVSFHTLLSSNRRKMMPELENLVKKRKRDDHEADQEISDKALKAKTINFAFDTELHLQTPLPLEWQRCLDVKSGQIYYYNTKTNKRTSRDPRLSPEPIATAHMSLDLELNLPCGSQLINDKFYKESSGKTPDYCSNRFLNSSVQKNNGGFTRSPSWLNFEEDQQEMVTAVCKNCHMLVMMCKSCPACPNCKFMHPPDQSLPNLFNRRLSLLC